MRYCDGDAVSSNDSFFAHQFNVKDNGHHESLMPRRVAEISDIAVLREYHSRGIGRQLFQACVAWSKARGAVSLDLQVWEFNDKTITFYEHLGMKPINTTMSLSLV